MARTSSSRGASGFKMRSGNSPMQGKFWDTLKKAVTGPVGMVSGLFGGGDDEAQGVEGTIATDAQKAALGGGMGKGSKFEQIHDRLHAGGGGRDISGVDLQPTALSKKYKYTKK